MALSGPRLDPKAGRATHLVVLCHGYGADGNDLLGLAPMLQRALPGAAFVAPNAPERSPGAGYQWFPITQLDPQDLHRGVLAATPGLVTYVKNELQRLALTEDRLAFVGFSQGTMMALHVGTNALRPAAIVGFSGLMTGAPGDAPPLLLVHGDADPVIPPEALFLTAGTLGAYGARVQWHLSHGVGHGIDETGIALAAAFLSQAFAGHLQAFGEACCALS